MNLLLTELTWIGINYPSPLYCQVFLRDSLFLDRNFYFWLNKYFFKKPTSYFQQREKLLELIRHLAEDDKEGVMAEKVLNLFWNLAHANDVAIDIMDQALSAHIKILDYSCTQYRETQKTRWLGIIHKNSLFS